MAARHQIENIGPFSSNLKQAGIQLTRAQSFVAEQIEIAMQQSLAAQTLADNGMLGVYQAAKRAFTPDGRDFYMDHTGQRASDADWAAATELEKAQAKQAYDLLFTTANSSVSGSNHLSRFIALSLVYPPLRAQLQNVQTNTPAASNPNEKLGAKVERLFNNVMRSIGRQVTGTVGSTNASEEMVKLAKMLALNEQRKRLELLRESSATVDWANRSLERLGERAQEGVINAAQSRIVRDSKNELIKALRTITTVIAQERVEEVLGTLAKWRDSERKNTRNSFLRNIGNEIQNETDENRVFYELLQSGKLIEQQRKQKKDIIQDEILRRFESFETLNKMQKEAITQLYLRSDMASLMDQGYSIQQIHKMVSDQGARQTKISNLQDALLKVPNGRDIVFDTTEMASHMATGRNTSEFGFQNASILMQYRRDSKATDQQHAQKIKQVDELASLLAVDMAPHRFHVAVRDVIARESARGDQDAFQYVVGMHRSVLEKSADTLFDAKGLTRIKGYVRESYNPYKTYEIADDTRGAELIDMGYTLFGPVNSASTSTSTLISGANATGELVNPKMYVLDVGLADYSTAAMQNPQMQARGALDQTRAEITDAGGSKRLATRQEIAERMVKARNTARNKRLRGKDPKVYRPGMQEGDTSDARVCPGWQSHRLSLHGHASDARSGHGA